MKIGFLATMLMPATAALAAGGSMPSCAERSQSLSEQWGRPVACYCGRDLSRLKVTLPTGLTLIAACGLTMGSGRVVDLRTETVSLDEYAADGDFPQGWFYLDGALVRSGVAAFQPSNSGELTFSEFEPVTVSRDTPFNNVLRKVKLDSEENHAKFRITDSVRATECSVAKARVQFRGFRVQIEDTDANGTYPDRVKILGISAYRPCKL